MVKARSPPPPSPPPPFNPLEEETTSTHEHQKYTAELNMGGKEKEITQEG